MREPQQFGLVREIDLIEHQDDRLAAFFEAPDDVWEIFRVLAEERRRREVEPTLTMLRSALQETPESDAERHAQARMREMHDLISRLVTWFDEVQKLSPDTAMKLMGMGAMVSRVLDFKDRMIGRTDTSKESTP